MNTKERLSNAISLVVRAREVHAQAQHALDEANAELKLAANACLEEVSGSKINVMVWDCGKITSEV